MQISEFLKLVRFEHAIMFAIAVFIGEVIANGSMPLFDVILILSILVPVFSEMASFALNDYLDVESDRINKKLTPLVRGTITKKFAFNFAWFAFIISTIIAYFINFHAFLIAFLFNLFAVFYNYKLKDIAFIGNLYIASTMAIPFIFGNFVIKNELDNTLLILALLGFLSGLAREIIKSVQDLKGDIKARKSKTLPAIIGEKNSLVIACLLYVIFIPLTFLPFYIGLKINNYSTVLIIIANLAILYVLMKIVTTSLNLKIIEIDNKIDNKKAGSKTKILKLARNVSLIALFIGLLAYLIAVL